MNLHLQSPLALVNSEIRISGSKSETNRLLILQALYPNCKIHNLSNSDDTRMMLNALASNEGLIDIEHAGTAMRFLTAFFAAKENSEVTLTGSDRMKQRPIKILVDALRQLGAQIEYLEQDGFPPIKITGKALIGSNVSVASHVSSQYITALLLIGAKLPNGITIDLIGDKTSVPYINMTLELLNKLGIETENNNNLIQIAPKMEVSPIDFQIESDWSSASYFYSVVALSQPGSQLTLSAFKKDSFQGDSKLVELYKFFDVATEFIDDKLILKKEDVPLHARKTELEPVELNLNDNPDLAQTIAVTCLGLGVECTLTGLQTLKIKETDRLEALQNELRKLGANVTTTSESLHMKPADLLLPEVAIETYGDHRMAMAFAPLALKVPIVITNAQVVSKSYPAFWDDLNKIGISFDVQ